MRTEQETSDFLVKIRKRFAAADDAERKIREEALIDSKMVVGDQWDPDAKRIRDDESRPCLTINRIPQFIHQVTNEQRQQRPSLQVNPEGSVMPSGQAINLEYEPDPRDSADIWQGLLRHIEVRSDAECAYDTAFSAAVGHSFGWWRITSEYAGDDTFDQELVIKRILDSFAVYVDPDAREADRSDMKWAFVLSKISKDEFKRLWPKTKKFQDLAAGSFSGDPGDYITSWTDADSVTIAEYWEITYRKRILNKFSISPDVLEAASLFFGGDIPATVNEEQQIEFTAFEDEYEGDLPKGVSIVDTRTVKAPEVRWYKLTDTDILEEGDWPGRWIPLIPCLGDELVVNGQRMLISLTRFIRDSQKLFNFMRSQQAEVIALTPKAPYVGAVGTFATNNERWQNANRKLYSYLEYDVVETPSGQVMPAPVRNIAEPPIQAINESCAMANDDLKAGTGIYDPSLGSNKSDQSGIAIGRLKQQAEISNFHFLDNFSRSMKHQGRILLDLIPHFYDRQNRIIRIVKPDNTHELVMINGITEYNGRKVFFNPDVGKYDISVEVGPSYQTKQEMSFNLLLELAKVDQRIIEIGGDLIMRAAPLPGSLGTELADRMKAVLPPAIAQIANGNAKMDPQAQAAIMQRDQMIQQLSQKMNELSEMIRTKKIELESKERIANMQGLVTLIAAELKAKVGSAETLATLDYKSIEHRLDLLHNMIGLDQEFTLATMPQPQAPQAQAA